MVHFVGLDVSVKATSMCVVDDAGKVILEQKVPTEPADIIALLTSLGVTFGRIGIEAGPLSQWLVNALTAADLPVICVETRHMKALLTAQQISKTDRNDARGIAQMMRVGLFKPVQQEQARRIDIGCALESGRTKRESRLEHRIAPRPNLVQVAD
jgi:transposase